MSTMMNGGFVFDDESHARSPARASTSIVVSSGHISSGLTIKFGSGAAAASLSVLYGGTVIDTKVSNRGYAQVSSGGIASNTSIGSGGLVTIFDGAAAHGVFVGSGGYVFVNPHGHVDGAVVSSGGRVECRIDSATSGTDFLAGFTLLSGAIVDVDLMSGGST